MSSSSNRHQSRSRELLEAAQVYSQQQKYDLALEQLNKALEQSPELAKNVRFYLNRGSYHFKLGKPALALEDFERASALDDKVASVHFNKGNVLKGLGNGRLEDALRAFQRASELDPKLVDAHVQISHLYIKSKRYQFALAAATRALEVSPNHLPALVAKLRALVFLSRFDEAVDTIDLMIQCYQRNAARQGASTQVDCAVPLPERKMLAKILLMACQHTTTHGNDAQRAISLAKHATELYPTYDTFFELGSKLALANRFADAALMFHKATEFDATKFDGFVMEGAMLISARQADKALAPLKRAGKLEEGRKEVRYYLGLAYFNMGRYLEAIPSLGRIVDDDALAEDDEVKEKARYLLSSCYIHAGEETKAYEQLKEARRSKRAGADVFYQAGYVSSLLGKDEEAKECFEQVLRIDPKDSRGTTGLANLKEKHAKVPLPPPSARPPDGPPPPPQTQQQKPSTLANKFFGSKPTTSASAGATPKIDKPVPAKSDRPAPPKSATATLLSFTPFRRTSKPTNLPGEEGGGTTGNDASLRWDCEECGCNNDSELAECFGCTKPRFKHKPLPPPPQPVEPRSKFALLAKATAESLKRPTSPVRALSPKRATSPVRALSPKRAMSPVRALSPKRAMSPVRALSPKLAISKAAATVTPRQPPPLPAKPEQPAFALNPRPLSRPTSGGRIPPPIPPKAALKPAPVVVPATTTTSTAPAVLSPGRFPRKPPPLPTIAESGLRSSSRPAVITDTKDFEPAVAPPALLPPPPRKPQIPQTLAEPNKPPPKPPSGNIAPAKVKPQLSPQVKQMISTLFAESESEFMEIFLEEGLETMSDLELLTTVEDFEKIKGMKPAWARRILKYVKEYQAGNNGGGVAKAPPPPVPSSRPPSTALLSDLTQFQKGSLNRVDQQQVVAERQSFLGNDMLHRIKSFERSSLRAVDLRPPPPQALNTSDANVGNNAFFGMILEAMNSRRAFIEDKQQQQNDESDEEDMFEAEW